MRAIAAVLVIAGHILEFSYSSGKLYEFGYWLAPFGLVVFFGISGFLLYRPFLAARAAGESVGEFTPSYLWRRVVRILPAYWVALTISTIWMSWPGVFSSHWWVYYGLLQTYSKHWFLNGLPTAWSLGVELTFYLLLPLIALGLARFGLGSGRKNALRWELGILLGVVFASLAWRVVLGTDEAENRIDQNLLGTLSWFGIGMIFAAAEVSHPAALGRLRAALSRPLSCWAIAIVCFALIPLKAASKVGLPPHLVLGANTVLYGLAAGLLLGPAIFDDGHGLVERALANRWIVFLGTVSYGLYLWHWPFVAWASSRGYILSLPLSVVWVAVITAVGTLIAATGSGISFEKPLMLRARSVKAFRHRREGEVEVAVDEGGGDDGAAPKGVLA